MARGETPGNGSCFSGREQAVEYDNTFRLEINSDTKWQEDKLLDYCQMWPQIDVLRSQAETFLSRK